MSNSCHDSFTSSRHNVRGGVSGSEDVAGELDGEQEGDDGVR